MPPLRPHAPICRRIRQAVAPLQHVFTTHRVEHSQLTSFISRQPLHRFAPFLHHVCAPLSTICAPGFSQIRQPIPPQSQLPKLSSSVFIPLISRQPLSGSLSNFTHAVVSVHPITTPNCKLVAAVVPALLRVLHQSAQSTELCLLALTAIFSTIPRPFRLVVSCATSTRRRLPPLQISFDSVQPFPQ